MQNEIITAEPTALLCLRHIALDVVRQGYRLCGGHILSPDLNRVNLSVQDWWGTGLHLALIQILLFLSKFVYILF